MSWRKHVQFLCNKLSESIGILKKARKTLYTHTLIQLYYSFLYPYLCTGILIWGKTNKTILDPLITIQKRAIRVVFNEKARAHTKPLFLKSCILPFNDIYLSSVLHFMFKVHHGKLPPVILDLIIKRHKVSKQLTRQSAAFHIRKHTTALLHESILYQGPSEFNKLNANHKINLNVSIHNFKSSKQFSLKHWNKVQINYLCNSLLMHVLTRCYYI